MQHPVAFTLKSQSVAVTLTNILQIQLSFICLLFLFCPSSSPIKTVPYFLKETLIIRKKKSTHLSENDRIRIDALFREGYFPRYIADRIGKSLSTISRGISRHTHIYAPKLCDCFNSPDCTLNRVCSSFG